MNNTADASGELRPSSLDPLHQLAILAGAIVFFGLFAWAVKAFFPQAARTARRIAGIPTAEEQEQRKQFVDEHLKSVEWNTATSSGSTSGHCSSEVEVAFKCNLDDEQGQEEEGKSTCEDIECPVCLTSFAQGDLVSSSTNLECPHVFHKACIYEWLLQKTGCPMCRNTFLVEEGSPVCISTTSEALTDDDEDC